MLETDKRKCDTMNNIKETKRLHHGVFWPPFLILLAAVILSFINEDAFAAAMNGAYDWLSHSFDWLYLMLALFITFLCLVIFCTKAGNIRFGGAEAKPQYSFLQWFAMSLCGGIAIGIVFWGVAEPITFLGSPNNGIEPFSAEAVKFAMSQSFFHWSFTPYALYAMGTIPIALAVYNYNRRMSISSGLYFLLGERCDGPIGTVVDAISLFALVGGISTSLGFGILQISGGLNYMFHIDSTPFLWAIVAIAIVAAFTVTSILGVDKGIKWLADQNFKLYVIVLAFILIIGPTTYILKLGTECFAEFGTTFLEKSLYLGAANGEDWSRWWTVFYWAVWFAYAPVIGIFYTRICYGRTVRQFLAVNLVAPALFCILWFTIFGGTAIEMQLSGAFDIFQALADKGTEIAVFAFFGELPLGMVLNLVFLLIIIISFVTMANSMTYTAAVMSTSGFRAEEGEPPMLLKLTWGIIMGVLAWVMLSFAGLDGARMLAVVASFPILIIMIAFCLSAIKGLYAPDQKWLKK